MKKKILATILGLLFLSCAGFTAWRQTAGANLKSGIGLYQNHDPGAEPVLKEGVRKNGTDYLLRYYLALAHQKHAFFNVNSKLDPLPEIAAARSQFLALLDIKSDLLAHAGLGQNFMLEGKMSEAVAHYNVAFFLSQNVSDLPSMDTLIRYQGQAAQDFFFRGYLGIPLILAFNRGTVFAPLPPKSPFSEFLESYFLSLPPEKWLTTTVKANGPDLKARFDGLGTEAKNSIAATLRKSGFDFLAEYLGA